MIQGTLSEQIFREEANKLNFSDDFLKLCLDPNNVEVRFTRSGHIDDTCDICQLTVPSRSILAQVKFQFCHPKCIPAIKCEYCDTRFSFKESGFSWKENGLICNKCIENLSACAHCKILGHPKEFTRGFCKKCYIPCHRCGNAFGVPEMYLLRGVRVCKTCGGRDIWVKGHDFNPLTILKFHGNPRNGIFFGVELEIESENVKACIEIAEDVSKNFGKSMVVKHDGSLRDHGQSGLEIVTAPGDFEFHKELWKEFFSKNYKFESFNSERCSTHVHISKQPLKPMQLARMAHFMYAEGNRAMIQKIGGRNLVNSWGNRYACISQKLKVSDVVEVYGGRSYFTRNYGVMDDSMLIPAGQRSVNFKRNDKAQSRYSALNLSNPNTAEVRIFCGTSTYDGMMKNIEFCQAMIDFCGSGKAVQSSLRDLGAEAVFIKFVKENRFLYPHLYKFMLGSLIPNPVKNKRENKEDSDICVLS